MIRTIYRVSKKLVNLLGSQEKSAAKEIIFIENPKEGLWVPGYVTNKVGKMLVVYVPTSPNPTSGFTIKEVFPDSKLLHFFEFFYRASGADVDFDPEFPSTLDDNLRVRTKNTIQLLSLADADRGLSPTHWQWSQYPPEFREKISVIFDGIGTDRIGPNPQVTM